MGEELSRVEDLLATGVEEPVEPMSRVEAILRGEDIKPLSRVEDLLKGYNPPDYEYIDLNVTENGTYTPPTGKMYKKAVVDVPSQAPVLTTLNATENGTYTPEQGYDGFDRVVVDIPAKDLDKVVLTQAEYNQLTAAQKEDPTKIYFIHKLKDGQYVMEPYLYYMDKKYEYEVPFDLESDNTVQTTSTQYITLESGYHYLFTTIYSGGMFSNNTTKEGGTSRVFNVDGYDRAMYIIKVDSESATDTVTYTRTGGIDSNKYIKFRIKQGDEYIDDAVFKNVASVDTAFTMSTSPTLSLEAGKYYMISYKASLPPNLTGATPICYAYLGETDFKKSISMIIRADSDTVVINDYNTSYSYFYYQKLLT